MRATLEAGDLIALRSRSWFSQVEAARMRLAAVSTSTGHPRSALATGSVDALKRY